MGKEVLNLTVEGMSCSHCENSIKKAVGGLDGVDTVSVDLKGKRVSVGYDPDRLDVKTIKDTIVDQGYEVK